MEDDNNMPPIPIFMGETYEAVSTLARAAATFRQAFMLIGLGRSFAEVMAEHEDVLLLSDRVVEHWRQHLGHDKEDDPG